MKATLGVSPDSNWQILAPLLEALGCAPVEDAYPESWYLGQHDIPDGHLLLAYTYPEQALVTAMQKGQEPAKALQKWERHIEALISLYKSNRDRAVIFNIQQAANNRERIVDAICSHWNLDITLPGIEDNTDDSEPDSYIQLIATYAVQQGQKLNALLAQLEACTLPVNGAESAPVQDIDPDHIYREVSKLRTSLAVAESECQQKHDQTNRLHQELENARQQSQQQQSALEEENQLLIEQLHLVQEKLETSLQVHENEKAAADKLKGEIDALKAAQVRSDEEKKQRVEALNKLRTSLNATESQYQQKHDQANRLQQELENARQQSQQQQSALEEENQLLIEQLHLVQEELERELVDKQALENQVQKLNQEQDHALAVANDQISRLQNELNRIKDSAAWKATAPVRAIGRPFKRIPPEKRKLKKQVKQLEATQYFDAVWYLKTYPDVAESRANPAEHYLKFGAKEGRNPCPEFDTKWYVQVNPDVHDSGINPLIHFLNHGKEEGRAPNPRVQNALPSPQEAK